MTTINVRGEMPLTAENVRHIFNECLQGSDETGNVIPVHAVQGRADFNADRIKAREGDINDMLHQLPDLFHVGSGDGWSFLNMCIDNNGNQWADMHTTCDMLVALGIAIGSVEFTIKQRDLWRAMPGGMPYITINIYHSLPI